MKFIVNEMGDVDSAHVIKPLYPSIDSIAVKIISDMRRWKHGKQNGKAVRVYFTVPLVFKLEDNKPKKQ